jgi:hypothetical protein
VLLKYNAKLTSLRAEMGDALTLQKNLSAVGLFKTRDDPQKRRLTTARRAERDKHFMPGNVEADICQYVL